MLSLGNLPAIFRNFATANLSDMIARSRATICLFSFEIKGILKVKNSLFFREALIDRSTMVLISPKNLRMMQIWSKRGMVWGSVGIIAFIWGCDIKCIQQNIPFYGRKFDQEHWSWNSSKGVGDK